MILYAVSFKGIKVKCVMHFAMSAERVHVGIECCGIFLLVAQYRMDTNRYNSGKGLKLDSYTNFSHCRSVLLLLTTVNWCPRFL